MTVDAITQELLEAADEASRMLRVHSSRAPFVSDEELDEAYECALEFVHQRREEIYVAALLANGGSDLPFRMAVAQCRTIEEAKKSRAIREE